MTDKTPEAGTGLYPVPDETAQAPAAAAEPIDWTGTRRVLRYKPDFDKDGLATLLVGDEPTVLHVGHALSSAISVYVECDGGTENATEVRLAALPTGAAVPAGATYLAMVREGTPFGPAVRHIYRLP